MRPRVIQFNGISLDGRMDWSPPGGEGLYYALAATFNADAMLSGSNTALAAYASQGELSEEEPDEITEKHPLAIPIIAIADSRGRIQNWRRIRCEPYWKKAVALVSHATPESYLDYLRECGVDYILAGEDHVDYAAALEELNSRFGVRVVRTDSGGLLNGVLFRAGLIDEVSVLVNPHLVGGTSPSSFYRAPDLTSAEGILPLKLTHLERLQNDILWLKYEVVK